MSVVEQMMFDERRDQILAEAGRIVSDLAKMVSNNGHLGHRDHLERKLYELVVGFTDADDFRANFMFSIATDIKQRLEFAEQARAVGDENMRLREDRVAEEKKARADIDELAAQVDKLRQDVEWNQRIIDDLRGGGANSKPAIVFDDGRACKEPAPPSGGYMCAVCAKGV